MKLGRRAVNVPDGVIPRLVVARFFRDCLLPDFGTDMLSSQHS